MGELSSLQERCGLFGCVIKNNSKDFQAAGLISLGLIGLQHRGQESAGIVTSNGVSTQPVFKHHRGMGSVETVFNESIIHRLGGQLGIGHTRYSTCGESEALNSQPFLVETTHGKFAVAHNGELVNARELRTDILGRGVGLSTESDSELITQLLCMAPIDGEPHEIRWPERIKQVMKIAQLSYSLLILYRDRIYAIRDPYGNRPLCLGVIHSSKPVVNGDNSNAVSHNSIYTAQHSDAACWLIASESCVFGSLGAKMVRELIPGEIVEICATFNWCKREPNIGTYGGFRSCGIVPRTIDSLPALCVFEYVYFSRPDSYMEGQQVYAVRYSCGKELAAECRDVCSADLVSCIPESAMAAAFGYASESGLPYVEVLCKNRYVGRTFIQPSEHLRQLGVAKKFGVLEQNFKNKRVIIVDDSIVRGNTIAPIVTLLKDNGALEVHIRVASPPIRFPCNMGINIPTRSELIANSMDAKALAKHLGVESLCYLSVEGLCKAVSEGRPDDSSANKVIKTGQTGHCIACLTGDYPLNKPYNLDF